MSLENLDKTENKLETIDIASQVESYLKQSGASFDELENSEYGYRFQLVNENHTPQSVAQHETVRQNIIDTCEGINDEQIQVLTTNLATSINVTIKEKPEAVEYIPKNMSVMIDEIEYFATVKRKLVSVVNKDRRYLKFQITDAPGAPTIDTQEMEYEKFLSELEERDNTIEPGDIEIITDKSLGTFFILDLDKTPNSK